MASKLKTGFREVDGALFKLDDYKVEVYRDGSFQPYKGDWARVYFDSTEISEQEFNQLKATSV